MNYIIPAVLTAGAVLVPVNTYEIYMYSKESKTNCIIKVVSGILTWSNDVSPTQMSMQEYAGYVARRTTPEFQFYTTAINSPVISDLPNSLQANATDMCGFFKREKKNTLEKWKRQSNFYGNRKTQRLNRIKSSTPKDDRLALSTE